MPDYLLKPPTIQEGRSTGDWLLDRYTTTRGIALIRRDDDSVYESHTPSLDELREAAEFWLGGHEHTISQATRDLLVAAGYGDYITPL